MPETSFDVLICGGGMTGAGLASILAQQGLKIAVFEATQPSKFDLSQAFDLRISALSPQTQSVLERTRAWQNLLAMRACAYRHMRVWEMQGFGDLTFHAGQVQASELGHIVENRVTQLALWQALEEIPEVTLFCPQKPVTTYRKDNLMHLLTDTGEMFTGKLLVAADGGQSMVREQFGIGVNRSQYQQACLVASVNTELGQQDITWQRFTATGPQAFLPLPGQHGSVVWYHQADEVRRLHQLSNVQLGAAIMQHFPQQLGTIEVLEKGYFNLQKQHAQSYVQDGLALIGDAAHMINPLAGQGVNLGFQDIACLDAVIAKARAAGKDWWRADVLFEYQRRRRWANRLMMQTMDAFYHGFSNEHQGLKWLRNGTLALARLSPIRRNVIRYAMGMQASSSVVELIRKL
ncbi:MAG: FAD-dependent monooxygenase [Gammaproteobacteria bacterium]|nr:FAD-dependent monooxygenase [Gammaproteobacteria bacterium]